MSDHGALFADEAPSETNAIALTVSAAQLGWIVGLVRSRVKKQRNRIASASEIERGEWYVAKLTLNLSRMEATLELLEQAHEDAEETRV